MKLKRFCVFLFFLLLGLIPFIVGLPKIHEIKAEKSCGSKNEPCCFDDNSQPYCNTGLQPFRSTGGKCFCRAESVETRDVYDVCQGNAKCISCLQEGGGNKKVWTALGCIPTDPLDLVKWIFPYLLGIGGTIAFFMLIIGGFQIMTSGGDPEKVKAGKEQITAAISGLLFIIFSLFILRFIGVDILGLPGLE